MPKLKFVFDGEEKEPERKPVHLAFMRKKDCFAVYDKNAPYAPELVYFYDDGTVELAPNVNPDIGFQLDDQGRIKCR